jgi:CTP synthase
VPQRPHLPQELKKKIALFCNMPESRVISMPDMDTIYGVPVALADEGLDDEILRCCISRRRNAT